MGLQNLQSGIWITTVRRVVCDDIRVFSCLFSEFKNTMGLDF